MNQEQLIQLAKQTAHDTGLDPVLVCAVCEQESGWNPWSVRFEPKFYKKYLSERYPEQTTESVGRACSWGLMQLMGETARELGFNAISFPVLCEPQTGLTFGCKLLKKCVDSSKGDITKALLKWNGGSNKQYPADVMARFYKFK